MSTLARKRSGRSLTTAQQKTRRKLPANSICMGTPRSFGRNDMNSRNYLWVPLIVLGLALTFTGAVLTPTLNGLGVWGFLIAAAGLVGASREDPFR